MQVSANELALRFNMNPHEEGGSYQELDAKRQEGKRDASGSIYYYLPEGEVAQFHVIDCDEYWAYSAGSTLELWCVSPNGKLAVQLLGVEEGCQPLIRIPAGTIFAAKHQEDAQDGTFLSCITVPRFEYVGWKLVSQEEVSKLCPEAAGFTLSHPMFREACHE